MFGKGLGTATVAENLGVYPRDLSPDAALASNSDFGTLLVERGWSGIAIVAFFATALAWTAWRILPFLEMSRWTTALTAAVPGAVCVMAAYGPLAEQLRNAAAALTFWLLVALGLSPDAFLGGRPWRKPQIDSRLFAAPVGSAGEVDDYAAAGRRKTN